MCDQIKELMNAYLDGDITESQIKELDLHVQNCEACMIEFEELKYLKHILDEEALMPLPDDFDERLHQRLLEASKDLNRKEEHMIKNIVSDKVVWFKRRSRLIGSVAAIFVVGIFAYSQLNGGLNLNMYSAKSESTAASSVTTEMASMDTAGAPEFYGTETTEAYDGGNGLAATTSRYTNDTSIPVDNVSNQDPIDGYRSGRIILKTANVSIQVEDFDATVQSIKSLLDNTEGYVESEQTSYKTRYTDRDNLKYGSLVLRVDAAQFDEMLELIKTQGFVNYDNVSSEDVTKYYRDTASQVENLKITENRLREILAEAKDISDILAIENELTRTRENIDALTNQLKHWEDLSDLSYMYVEIDEVESLNPVIEPIDNSIFTKGKEGFIETINSIIRTLSEIVVWIIAKAPLLAIIGLISWIAVRIYRKKK